MSARWFAFVIWAAVAALAAFWALRFGVRGYPVPAHAQVAAHEPGTGGDWRRLFGVAAAAPAAAEPAAALEVPAARDDRFKLVGVVAPNRASVSEGIALVSVDGGPAKAYLAGQALEPDLRVLRVGHRRVELGQPGQPPRLVLELAALPPASTGVPIGSAQPGAPAPAPMTLPPPGRPVPNAAVPAQAARPPAAPSAGPVVGPAAGTFGGPPSVSPSPPMLRPGAAAPMPPLANQGTQQANEASPPGPAPTR